MFPLIVALEQRTQGVSIPIFRAQLVAPSDQGAQGKFCMFGSLVNKPCWPWSLLQPYLGREANSWPPHLLLSYPSVLQNQKAYWELLGDCRPPYSPACSSAQAKSPTVALPPAELNWWHCLARKIDEQSYLIWAPSQWVVPVMEPTYSPRPRMGSEFKVWTRAVYSF